ncbi:hypothetical protein EV702DRAFT_1042470 [Suillus placidus]|uniref:Uncharacterized protein n=1 Tax=Suillus placidus TaxID=48579 RepID=A0A9P7A4M2_9AGAM|nr:hypothetical protein EV702DRAFT_1042470 [Suillus placidus]
MAVSNLGVRLEMVRPAKHKLLSFICTNLESSSVSVRNLMASATCQYSRINTMSGTTRLLFDPTAPKSRAQPHNKVSQARCARTTDEHASCNAHHHNAASVLAVADPASTVLRVSRHSKSSSLVLTKSVLSALLVRRGKFIARAGGSGCPSGYRKEFMRQCNDLYNCPNDTTSSKLTDEHYNQCFGSECCPNTAQTCNGNACCSSGSECCNDNSCCEPGLFCCNDTLGGCCPTGSTCIANSYQCSTGGSGGGSSGGGSGGSSGGGGGGTSVTTATPSKSTVLPGTTSASSGIITFNGPTATGSSSRSTSTGLTQTAAAPRGIALAPGKQLVALVAVIGLPILHNVAQAL